MQGFALYSQGYFRGRLAQILTILQMISKEDYNSKTVTVRHENFSRYYYDNGNGIKKA